MADEAKLLQKLKNRDQRYLEHTIDLYTPYLSVVLYNYTGNNLPQQDVEEIISDVFVTLWKNADFIDLSKGSIRSYISKCAKNLALKRIMKNHESISIDDVEIASYEENKDTDYIWSCVMELGEPDNEIFVRYYKYGEKLKDIAKAVDIPLSTVKTKLLRGKKKLRLKLTDTEELL